MSKDNIREWQDVGVHPTPSALVRFFAITVAHEVSQRFLKGGAIRIVDACAGDGRLGHAIARRLKSRGFNPEVTFIEASLKRVNAIRPGRSYVTRVLTLNFFSNSLDLVADVVVSNPPYLNLSRKRTAELGLAWDMVTSGGRNLYGLALLRCIEICAPRGIVGFLGPHGWLTNQGARTLRNAICKKVGEVRVDAFSSRRLFPGVNQDVSVQIMPKLAELDLHQQVLRTVIGYDGSSKLSVTFSPEGSGQSESKVRVGLFVWNREKQRLSKSRGGVPVVYGGNISKDGVLSFNNERYSSRQFLLKGKTPDSYINRAPCIVVKRSMRGCPGMWELDLAVVSKRGFKFVAENHVIVIPFKNGTGKAEMELVAKQLRALVEGAHRHYGHPNLSVSLIKYAMQEIVRARCEAGPPD